MLPAVGWSKAAVGALRPQPPSWEQMQQNSNKGHFWEEGKRKGEELPLDFCFGVVFLAVTKSDVGGLSS